MFEMLIICSYITLNLFWGYPFYQFIFKFDLIYYISYNFSIINTRFLCLNIKLIYQLDFLIIQFDFIILYFYLFNLNF